jgi:CheY-like chemotaxis protein
MTTTSISNGATPDPLPKATLQPMAADRSDPGQSPAGDEPILVVDDNEEIRMLLADTLGQSGYSVVEAGNGQEAIQRYSQAGVPMRVVLLDLHLPDMTGWEVLAALRQLNPSASVLIISGSTTEDLTQKVKDSGAAGFVPKPFDRQFLLGRIRSLPN